MTGTKQKAGEHAGKSRAGDVLSQHIRPFTITDGRHLDYFSNVNANLFESLVKYKLRKFMCCYGQRTFN